MAYIVAMTTNMFINKRVGGKIVFLNRIKYKSEAYVACE